MGQGAMRGGGWDGQRGAKRGKAPPTGPDSCARRPLPPLLQPPRPTPQAAAPPPPHAPLSLSHLRDGDLGHEADAQVFEDDAVGRGKKRENVGDKVLLVGRQLLPVRGVPAQVDFLGCECGVGLVGGGGREACEAGEAGAEGGGGGGAWPACALFLSLRARKREERVPPPPPWRRPSHRQVQAQRVHHGLRQGRTVRFKRWRGVLDARRRR